MENNDLIDDDNIEPPIETYIDKLIDDDIEPPIESYIDKLIDDDMESPKDELDKEMLLALDISKKEYFEYSKYDEEEFKKSIQLSDEEYNIKLVEIDILKDIRIKSLEMFCKKIKGLGFSENDKKIKEYIEIILNEYFNLIIDNVNVEDDMYNKLYEIIDSYYLIPSKKKNCKTFISHEEDNIIRTIFLKKNLNT